MVPLAGRVAGTRESQPYGGDRTHCSETHHTQAVPGTEGIWSMKTAVYATTRRRRRHSAICRCPYTSAAPDRTSLVACTRSTHEVAASANSNGQPAT